MICPDCGLLRHPKTDCKFIECPNCEGHGRVEEETIHGGVDNNGPWQSYRTRWTECDRCQGWGEIAAEGEDDE